MSGLPIVLGNLNKWAVEKKVGIEGLGRVAATSMTNYARQNKRWQDRTGNARAGLHGNSFWQNPFMLIIFIAHAMEYGIFLELAHDGKYAILEETANKYSKEVHENAKRIMNAWEQQ